MISANEVPKDVSSYIAAFPPAVQKLLKQLRQLIQATAPGAEDVISYRMPAYKYKGVLVYFAGYKNHIGFYPGSAGIEQFINQLSDYQISKGTLQLPLDQPLPVKLLVEIIRFRIKENEAKAALKKSRKQIN
jgi:uncharacterized protein YdhG (YjbR/CyaY superfamily)